MRLNVSVADVEFHHDVRSSFGELLRRALEGKPVLVGHGPVYADDPAAEVMSPFVRSARESGWIFDEIAVPRWVLDQARSLRAQPIVKELWEGRFGTEALAEVDRWTRAGLVLETAGRWGIPRSDGLRTHVRWRLRGTVTGRFGIEPGSFNPMVIPADDRWSVAASYGHALAAIDFNAFDLRSMVSLVPDMWEWYQDADDLHQRTADIMDLTRDEAKVEIFLHAYGGTSRHAERFERRMPYLAQVRAGEHGDGARRVQAQSARAFRAALSGALPLLVEEDVRPLFTVHDEVVLEVRGQIHSSEVGAKVHRITEALERGAAQTIGVPYRTKATTGRTYAECKSK